MKNWKIWYKIGAWAILLIGALHNLASVMLLCKPITDVAHLRVIEGMKSISPAIPTTHSLWDFHVGFSYVFGWMLIAFGILALLSMRAAEADKRISLFNAGVSLLICVYAVRYFFIAPVLLSGIALLAFLVSFRVHKP